MLSFPMAGNLSPQFAESMNDEPIDSRVEGLFKGGQPHGKAVVIFRFALLPLEEHVAQIRSGAGISPVGKGISRSTLLSAVPL